jgi:hypothetical protein
LDASGVRGYQRHQPETTALYAVVRDNVETLYAAVAAGFEGATSPPFVRREPDGYLDRDQCSMFLDWKTPPPHVNLWVC